MPDPAAVRAEVLADPHGLGYKNTNGSWKSDQVITTLFNAVPPTPLPGRTLDRDIVETWEILEATVPNEWRTLNAIEKQYYQTIIATQRISLRGGNVRAALTSMFPAGSATLSNFTTLFQRPASRSEVLYQEAIQNWDIGRARALT